MLAAKFDAGFEMSDPDGDGALDEDEFRLFILTVAAAEAAIGLAIVLIYYRNRGSIAVEDINLMKG